MIFSTNRLVGSLVYQTRTALNANKAFMDALTEYKYYPNCLYDDKFHLWHYPGTHEEISHIMVELGKTIEGQRQKFPCIMNFLPVAETIINSGRVQAIQVRLNLAICATTFSEWKTQTRERIVFDKVLRPIYEEFIHQSSRSGYLQNGYGIAAHTKHEIYTTGANAGQIHDRYNEFIDAIEISNLLLTLDPTLCDKFQIKMSEESDKVLTEFI